MAADWIKMRIDLQSHPKVVRILSATGTDKFRVVGGLHAVWGVFDIHSEDGILRGYTPELMDHIIGWPGFSQAMINVGWLRFDGDQVLDMPEFSEHNGQSAKRRAEDQKRKRNGRNHVRNLSATDADKKRTDCGLEKEKRREEKKEQKQKTAPDGELFEGVSGQVIADFKALRSKLRAPVTATAMAGIRREAERAGLSMNDALAMCCERGWRGFNAGWVDGPTRAKEQTAGTPRKRRMLA